MEVSTSVARRRRTLFLETAAVNLVVNSPESSIAEAIIHAVDQYQSEASGADIKYKVSQKAKNGGPIGPTSLDYLNIREPKSECNEIRTVAVDPEHGHSSPKASACLPAASTRPKKRLAGSTPLASATGQPVAPAK